MISRVSRGVLKVCHTNDQWVNIYIFSMYSVCFTCEEHEQRVVWTTTVTWQLSEIDWGHRHLPHISTLSYIMFWLFLTVIACLAILYPPRVSFQHTLRLFYLPVTLNEVTILTLEMPNQADCFLQREDRITSGLSQTDTAVPHLDWFGFWQVVKTIC